MAAGHGDDELAGLPDATPGGMLELGDGDACRLEIAPVRKRLGGSTVRMLAYNGSVPGPTLVLRQGSKATVHVTNRGDLETTVHWHGLRLDSRYDGTHDTQSPIPVGGTFRYELAVPDPGAYWYHPHIREDYAQELGLYGNVLVVPSDPDYWPPAHRELPLTVDDVLLEDGRIAAFGEETTHVAMGRFGNVMLVGGEAELALEARRGEVVRLFLTNTANTRVFNVALPGARMKLVGGDSGRVEHEAFVEEVLLAPSERAVVDVCFDEPGALQLEHRTPERTYRLARITVSPEEAEPSLADAFATLRTNDDLVAERERIAPYLEAAPDKTLALAGELVEGGDAGAGSGTHGGHGGHGGGGHGRGHAQHGARDARERGPAHGAHAPEEHERAPAQGIEWEDDMLELNRLTTRATMRWKLIDRDTGAANTEIDWRFRVGDQVKIRLVNEPGSDHPMPHPFHLHGAGRFLVLSRNGVIEPNLVWKDTVLLRTGETVDILLSVTHPGRWMAHCHIAEHHEGGMAFGFTVDER
jgi:FtsP/CotA-like multicopper oxidase with cupredoxin domain